MALLWKEQMENEDNKLRDFLQSMMEDNATVGRLGFAVFASTHLGANVTFEYHSWTSEYVLWVNLDDKVWRYSSQSAAALPSWLLAWHNHARAGTLDQMTEYLSVTMTDSKLTFGQANPLYTSAEAAKET